MKEETILKNEWTKRYNLTAVSQSKYYKIVGCFAIGFELMKIYGEIKPYFVIYPLWREDVKMCFCVSYLYHCIEDSKGLDYSLPISKMLEKKEEIFLNAEKYMGFDLTKDIHKNQILDIFDKYLYNKYLNEYSTNPVEQDSIFILKTFMATYLNDQSLFDDILASMKSMEDYARKNPQRFEQLFGKRYDFWKEDLVSVFSNRQIIIEKINANIANGKIKEKIELLP